MTLEELNKAMRGVKTLHDCDKCNGRGEVHWKHVDNGICFKCGGSGRLDYKPVSKLQEVDRDVDGDSWTRQEAGETNFLMWASGNE